MNTIQKKVPIKWFTILVIIFDFFTFSDIYSQEKPQGIELLTFQLKYDWKLTNEDLLKLQYYNGCTIKLQLIESQTQYSRDIDNYSRQLSTTINRKEIIIPQWTPGVAVAAKGAYIDIDFGDGVIIPFGYLTYTVTYKDNGYGGRGENITTLKVNGQKYKVEIINPKKDPNSPYRDIVSLYVDNLTTNSTTNEIVDTKTVPGRKVKK